MKLRPLYDRIVVKRTEEDHTSPGGIGKRLDNGQTAPLAVKVGDEIFFGKYSGTEVKMDNEEYLIIREDDVMAIVN